MLGPSISAPRCIALVADRAPALWLWPYKLPSVNDDVKVLHLGAVALVLIRLNLAGDGEERADLHMLEDTLPCLAKRDAVKPHRAFLATFKTLIYCERKRGDVFCTASRLWCLSDVANEPNSIHSDLHS
jgi:hypothetical protein